MTHDPEILVKVEGVSKKFCRNLKKSLWYGMKDVASELLPFQTSKSKIQNSEALRPGEFWANKDISFELRRGECLGLIGHNGAGKTTLLKMLNGLVMPDTGTIEMRGRVGALIALGAGFSPILTGRENIYVNGSVLGLSKTEINSKLDEIIDFADIGDFIDTPVQNYSSGMQVRLGFAVATALTPDVLLLDEVLAVGDMAFQAKCYNRLGILRKQGTAFILVSHNMHHITRFTENVLHLGKGRKIFHGSAAEGVASFYSELAAKSPDLKTDLQDNDKAGSLSVEISKFYFTDQNGIVITSTPANRPVNLIIEYVSNKATRANPIVDVAIRLPTGDAFFQESISLESKNFGIMGSSGKITLSFPSIPANNTSLTAAVSIWDESCEELYHWRRGARLEIKGSSSSTGLVLIDCRWSHASLKH